jgi:hypothetical protein
MARDSVVGAGYDQEFSHDVIGILANLFTTRR